VWLALPCDAVVIGVTPPLLADLSESEGPIALRF
jgi:hypothetical protein